MNQHGPLQLQVLEVLRQQNREVPRMLIDRLCTLGKSIPAISRALDELAIHDEIVRIDRGREVYYRLATVTPAAKVAEPALQPLGGAAIPKRSLGEQSAVVQRFVAPLSDVESVSRTVVIEAPVRSPDIVVPRLPTIRERVLHLLRAHYPDTHSNAEIASHLGIEEQRVGKALNRLKMQGRVMRVGESRLSRWHATPLNPVGATPATQAQVVDNSASEGAAPLQGTSRSETSPSAPRDGASNKQSTGSSTNGWHGSIAEADELRRLDPSGLDELALVLSGDLPNRQLATGQDVPPPPKVQRDRRWRLSRLSDLHGDRSVITDARYALWSDGQLHINSDDETIVLSQGATRALIDYLDRVCAIDMH